MANTTNWDALYREAHEAGMRAGKAATPRGMRVVQHADPFDDNSPAVETWDVPEGPCGFAWVTVKPGTSAFARWLKRSKPNTIAGERYYYGGVYATMVHEFGQSLTRKDAYARAFAGVLREHGVTAYAGSRMD